MYVNDPHFSINYGLFVFSVFIALLAFTKQPPEVKKKKDDTKQTSIMKLARDPYIMIATGKCYCSVSFISPKSCQGENN